MRYVAAYLLAVLAGNASPDLATLNQILSSVGVKVDEAQANRVINELKGKSLETLIKEGTAKLASVPSGGAAPAAAAAAPAAKEEPSN
jgi:large subunit ribosomal protein LP2